MNRPYIFDLRPGASFVEYMVKKGYDVFLIDWGNPGPEDQNLKLDDYVLDYLVRAIRKIKSVSGAETFNMLGWCIGAILATCYGALRPDDGLRNLILLTAPLDFSDKKAGGFVGWVNERAFNVDRLLARFGNVPGELIDYGAKALRPVDNYLTHYLKLWDNLDNPMVVESWHAMDTWVNDNIDMAGGFYRQLIRNLYNDNELFEGQLTLRGERVDVGRVRANLLMVLAASDHIVPSCQSEAIFPKFAGSLDKQMLRVPGGHIGLMAGSGAVKNTWPHIETWLAARSR
jgi:polyhydroxyalkanoate synthase